MEGNFQDPLDYAEGAGEVVKWLNQQNYSGADCRQTGQ
jgi:hypothetical protein